MNAIEEQFGKGKSLYEVLEVSPTASAAEIKKAYFKAALKYHPDKCPGDEAANGRFQALSMVHAVLSDSERRSLYDETGEVAEDGQAESAEEGDMWFDYWRTLFPKITEADVDTFSEKYKGSEEETRDVVGAYKTVKGRMSAVVDSIMLASDADEERFRGLIESAIQRKEVPRFTAFREKTGRGAKKAATKRRAKMDKEAAEAEELMAKLKKRDTGRRDAASLSAHRSKQFDNMVSSLEARYGGSSARSSSSKQGNAKRAKRVSCPDNLDDAEFERIQKQLEQKRIKR